MPGSICQRQTPTHQRASAAAQLSLDNLQRVTERLRNRCFSLRIEGLEADTPENHRQHRHVNLILDEANQLADLGVLHYRVPQQCCSLGARAGDILRNCVRLGDFELAARGFEGGYLAGGKFGPELGDLVGHAELVSRLRASARVFSRPGR